MWFRLSDTLGLNFGDDHVPCELRIGLGFLASDDEMGLLAFALIPTVHALAGSQLLRKMEMPNAPIGLVPYSPWLRWIASHTKAANWFAVNKELKAIHIQNAIGESS